MDKEKETHDFMNVESFSQLPFLRPHAGPVKEKGIRLFGIEFGSDTANTTAGENSADSLLLAETTNNNNHFNEDHTTVIKENDRRFACHYCCRNFPTSQALGGHQNAHKRERQHAKRAHLQSSSLVHNSLTADAHFYGLMNNYSCRLTGAAATRASPNITYPSWTSTTSSSSSATHRFYGNHNSFSHQTPINGSPLGLWRIPGATATTVQSHQSSFNRDHSMHHPLPFFATDQELKSSHMQIAVGGSRGGSGSGSSSESRFVYESNPISQDHVNLDLHL